MTISKKLLLISFCFLATGCQLPASNDASVKDSQTSVVEVKAVYETRTHQEPSDVDDPAIWVNAKDTSKSIVAATLKKGGMDVYDMQGNLLQFIAPTKAPLCQDAANDPCENKGGRWNNVDVIYGFDLNGESVDLFIASDRGTDKLNIWLIDPQAIEEDRAPIKDITSANQAPRIFTSSQEQVNEGETAYGMAAIKTDKTYVYITQNNQPAVAQAILEVMDDGSIGYNIAQTLRFPSTFTLPNNKAWQVCNDEDGKYPQFEGIVADTYNNVLYLGQEDIGIWRVDLSQPENVVNWQLMARTEHYGVPYTRVWSPTEEEYICTLQTDESDNFGNAYLHDDVEGLTLYEAGKSGKGYLIASSQGNDTYAVFDRSSNNEYLGSFKITDGKIDGVSETDGLMVSNTNFGGELQEGVIIMQDGDNTNKAGVESTNFKYTSWGDIARAMNLIIDTSNPNGSNN